MANTHKENRRTLPISMNDLLTSLSLSLVVICVIGCSSTRDIISEEVIEETPILNMSLGDSLCNSSIRPDFSYHKKDNVNGRKVLYRDYDLIKAYYPNGVITTKVCVTPVGDVCYVQIIDEETDMNSNKLKQHTLESLMKYKYSAIDSIDHIECGTHILKIDTQ